MLETYWRYFRKDYTESSQKLWEIFNFFSFWQLFSNEIFTNPFCFFLRSIELTHRKEEVIFHFRAKRWWGKKLSSLICLQPPNCSMMQLVHPVTLWAAAKVLFPSSERRRRLQRISLRVSAFSRQRETLDLIRSSHYKLMDFIRFYRLSRSQSENTFAHDRFS